MGPYLLRFLEIFSIKFNFTSQISVPYIIYIPPSDIAVYISQTTFHWVHQLSRGEGHILNTIFYFMKFCHALGDTNAKPNFLFP